MSSWICGVKRKPFFIHFRELEIQEQLAFTALTAWALLARLLLGHDSLTDIYLQEKRWQD